jgi:hypothetical protein
MEEVRGSSPLSSTILKLHYSSPWSGGLSSSCSRPSWFVGLIQPRGLQLAPQHADPLPQASSDDGPRVVVRASGSRLHRFPAAGLVAGHQDVHPTPHLVSACCFGLAQLLLYHRYDDDPFLRHGSSSKPGRYERCLDSPMNDVLNHDTLSTTGRSAVGGSLLAVPLAPGCTAARC